MGLKDNELRWLSNHLGHTEKVHLQHYRAISGLLERIDVAKLMLMQEKGNYSQFAGVALNDINFEDMHDTNDREPQPGTSNQEDDDIEDFEDGSDFQLSPVKKKANAGTRVPWEKDETAEIEKYFKQYISLESSQPCPRMKDILQVEKFGEEIGKLLKRKFHI